jgi:hypothetical protein
MRAICGALINVLEASRISARSLTDALFDDFESRFNRAPAPAPTDEQTPPVDASEPPQVAYIQIRHQPPRPRHVSGQTY